MVASVQRRAESADELVAEVTRIVREATGVGAARELPPEEPLGALGLDSLAIVNVVAAVEGRFARELPDALWEDRRGISIASLAAAVGQCGVRPRRAAPARPSPARPSSRASRASSGSSCNSRGAAREAASPPAHCTARVIVAHWLRAQPALRRPHARPRRRPARCPAARGPHDRALRRRLRRAAGRDLDEDAGRTHAQPTSDGACRAASICLAAWEGERIVAYDLLGPTARRTSPPRPAPASASICTSAAKSRGRGIGLALLAASLPYTRDLGFSRQATIVLERNRPMIAAATQLLGFSGRRPRRAQRAARSGALELAAARIDVQRPASRDLNQLGRRRRR